jgi:L-rhamnose mutarotase
MYNEEFLQKVIKECGVEQASIFCQLESEKCNAQYEEMDMGDAISISEIKYERDWWAERAKSLKNNKTC